MSAAHADGGGAAAGSAGAAGAAPGAALLTPSAFPLGSTSTLILGGANDTIVPNSRQRNGFETSDSPKRLAIGGGVGHQFCADLCWIAEAQGGIVKVATACGINVAPILGECGCCCCCWWCW